MRGQTGAGAVLYHILIIRRKAWRCREAEGWLLYSPDSDMDSNVWAAENLRKICVNILKNPLTEGFFVLIIHSYAQKHTRCFCAQRCRLPTQQPDRAGIMPATYTGGERNANI